MAALACYLVVWFDLLMNSKSSSSLLRVWSHGLFLRSSVRKCKSDRTVDGRNSPINTKKHCFFHVFPRFQSGARYWTSSGPIDVFARNLRPGRDVLSCLVQDLLGILAARIWVQENPNAGCGCKWLWVKNRETPKWLALANTDENLRSPGSLILTHTQIKELGQTASSNLWFHLPRCH